MWKPTRCNIRFSKLVVCIVEYGLGLLLKKESLKHIFKHQLFETEHYFYKKVRYAIEHMERHLNPNRKEIQLTELYTLWESSAVRNGFAQACWLDFFHCNFNYVLSLFEIFVWVLTLNFVVILFTNSLHRYTKSLLVLLVNFNLIL